MRKRVTLLSLSDSQSVSHFRSHNNKKRISKMSAYRLLKQASKLLLFFGRTIVSDCWNALQSRRTKVSILYTSLAINCSLLHYLATRDSSLIAHAKRFSDTSTLLDSAEELISGRGLVVVVRFAI